jgi:ATP-binding protein involved in chromosome partitioning
MTIKTMIAISSGKGGVGKSTVASNFAVALARTGASVGLMDADITGPNLPLLMGLEGERPHGKDDKMAPLEAHGVQVISMGFLVDPEKAIIWRGPMIHHAIQQLFTDVAWGDLDYMIIDLPPGTGDAQLTLAQTVPLSGAVIVTQPQQVALGDARRGITMFRQVDVPILGIVENMSGDFFGNGGGEQLAQAEGVPYLGTVPLDPQVRIGGDAGTPIVVSDPDSAAAQALTSIALEVAKRADETSGDSGDDVIQLRTIG